MNECIRWRAAAPAWLTLSLLAAAPGLSAPPGRPAGELLNVAGQVGIERGKQPVMKGTLLSWLQNGDVIRVSDGATAEVLLFGSGGRFKLAPRSAARVEESQLKALSGPPPRPCGAVSRALKRRITMPNHPGARLLGTMERNPERDVALGPRHLSPDGAVRAEPVALRWSGYVDGDKLHLQIKVGDHTIHSTDLSPNIKEYRVPAGVLEPGLDYRWSVAAVRAGDSGQSAVARLRLLRPEERAEIDQIERELEPACAAAPSDPAPLLLLAQAYEQLDLSAEASATYQVVLRLRPDDPGVKSRLQRPSASP